MTSQKEETTAEGTVVPTPNADKATMKRCLICDEEDLVSVREPEKDGEDTLDARTTTTAPEDTQSGQGSDGDAYICAQCHFSEFEQAEMMNEIKASLKDHKLLRADGQVADGSEGLATDTDTCSCQACKERRDFELIQEKELEMLQKCWVQLRHAVRQMYRDKLDEQLKTERGKQFDVNKLKTLVQKLVDRDPHQLYQRLEALGREYAMEMKVNLLQILVSPEKYNLPTAPGSDGSGGVNVEQARCFLRFTLDAFSAFQETVRHMQPVLQDLDKTHLEKFGISWKVVNHHLFDSVVYQDALIQSSLPAMAQVLCVELVCPDNESERTKEETNKETKQNLPLAAQELSKSFRALDQLMKTSREIWEKANRRMEEFYEKQMRLYKATLKAKQRMLKEDLEFFKQQRRLLEKYVNKSKTGGPNNKQSSTEGEGETDEDLTVFTNTLRNILVTGSRRPSKAHAASTVECQKCQVKHCPCDECTISHVISCGLVSEEDDMDLQMSAQMLDELPSAIVDFDFEFDEHNDGSTTDGSEGDEEESSTEDDDGDLLTDCLKTACKEAKGEPVKQHTTARPLYTLHNHIGRTTASAVVHNNNGGGNAKKHFNYAYGDWEPAFDQCTYRLFSTGFGGGKKIKPPAMKLTSELDAIMMEKGVECSRVTPYPAPPTTHKHQRRQRTGSLPNHHQHKCLQSQAKPLGNITTFDNLPPDLLKFMKEETLSKALTMAAAKSGLLKPEDLKAGKVNWKDLNIDEEALRRYYEAHSKDVRLIGETPLPTPELELASFGTSISLKKPDGTTISKTATTTANAKSTTTASQDSQSNTTTTNEEENDGCWGDSDDDSSLSHGGGGKHCDCCYCEMFGPGGGVDPSKAGICGGRDPLIRERLRLKLKKRVETGSVCQSKAKAPSSEDGLVSASDDSAATNPPLIDGSGDRKLQADVVGNTDSVDPATIVPPPAITGNKAALLDEENIDSLLEYIEGGSVVTEKTSTKSAKRQRQKQRRAAEQQLKAQQQQQRLLVDNNENNLENKQANPESPKKKAKKHGRKMAVQSETNSKTSSPNQRPLTAEESTNQRRENCQEELEEAFKPNLDKLDRLDEADRDVELFKQFVLDCQPKVNRAKVQLNLSSLLKNRITNTNRAEPAAAASN